MGACIIIIHVAGAAAAWLRVLLLFVLQVLQRHEASAAADEVIEWLLFQAGLEAERKRVEEALQQQMKKELEEKDAHLQAELEKQKANLDKVRTL